MDAALEDWGFEERQIARLDINKAARSLPKRDRIVLRLRFVEGLILADIGELLNLSSERVRSLEARGLRKLKPKLQQWPFDKYDFLRHQAERKAQQEAQERQRTEWKAQEAARMQARQAQAERDRVIAAAAAQRAEQERISAEAWKRARPQVLTQHRSYLEQYRAALVAQYAMEQERSSAKMMLAWNDLVSRKGWTPEEAQTYWHDWLTGPPGYFG